MRRFWLFAVYGIVAVTLESTLFASLPSQVVRFDLILLAVIALALAEDQRGVIASVVMLGLFVDVSSSAPFGLATFSLLMIYGFIRMIIAKISIEIWFARFVWVALASLLYKVVTGILTLAWLGNLSVARVLIRSSLPQAAFDGLVGLVLIPLIMKYDGLTWEKIFKPKGLILK
jgi:rod shape-determining protein MreD